MRRLLTRCQTGAPAVPLRQPTMMDATVSALRDKPKLDHKGKLNRKGDGPIGVASESRLELPAKMVQERLGHAKSICTRCVWTTCPRTAITARNCARRSCARLV